MTPFDRALAFVLQWEGGYSKDPADPGGETKFGITLRSYPHLTIKNLTEEDARTIYLRDFWNFLHCDQMPSTLAFLVFDAAVNQGQGAAVLFLQHALGVKMDGVIGP